MFKFNILSRDGYCCTLLISLLTYLQLPLYTDGAIRGFPSSACPNIFHYQYDEKISQWFGIILIRSPPPLGHPMELIVFLSIKSSIKPDYLGAMELMESRAESIENIRRGHPVRYRVTFPMLPTLPKVNRIVLNNWIICTGQLDLGFYVTEIRLEHTLYTQLASHQTTSYPIEFIDDYDDDDDDDEEKPTILPTDDNNQLENTIEHATSNNNSISNTKSNNNATTKLNATNQNATTTTTPSTNSRQQAFYVSEVTEEQMICGRPVLKMSHFIVDDRHLSHGSWPWSVALFTREQFTGQPKDYICGGTLVSTKVIVTAAHCMQRAANRKRYASEIVAYFGRTRYDGNGNNEQPSSTVQQQIEDIDTIIMHPDYKKFGQTFDADIALIIVRARIRYGKLIRPICLWPNADEFEVSSDSDDTAAVAVESVQKNDKDQLKKSTEIDGIVVIWGRDSNEHSIAKKSRIINVKIVSDTECLQQNTMYNDIISNRTFCAQGHGRAPCFGDSGSGMAVKQLNNRWYLRGIVSGGLSDPTCTASNFVVFTDATKFIDFITPYMLL